MTKREYFAAMALQGMCANADISAAMTERGLRPSDVRLSYADSSAAQADALIEALNRKQE